MSATPFKTVIFDCDSTLSAVEGIDELARMRGADVAALTEAAMLGMIPLEEVYQRRLELVRPTLRMLQQLGELYVEHAVPHAREVCQELQAAGADVRVISGGLLPAVLHLTRHLGIPDSGVAAVPILFDRDGEYASFDTSSPLARSGGKLEYLLARRDEMHAPVMLVGDGSTDLEARPAVDAFVAYAGVVRRGNVIGAADHIVTSESLAPVLALATSNLPLRPSGDALRIYGLTLLHNMENL